MVEGRQGALLNGADAIVARIVCIIRCDVFHGSRATAVLIVVEVVEAPESLSHHLIPRDQK